MPRRHPPRRWLASFCAACLAALALQATASDPAPDVAWGHGPHDLAIATGSPGETGLLERLATGFAERNDARISWYRAGSGTALGIEPAGDRYRVTRDFMTASLRRGRYA